MIFNINFFRSGKNSNGIFWSFVLVFFNYNIDSKYILISSKTIIKIYLSENKW